MVVCVSPDLVVSLGQRLTGSPKSKEKLCQYTSLLDLPSVCEETHVGRACKEQWRGYTLLRRQLLGFFFPLLASHTGYIHFDYSDVSGKKIPILWCSCACMLAWWLNNVGKKVYRTLLPQQPLTAGGFCQALELKNATSLQRCDWPALCGFNLCFVSTPLQQDRCKSPCDSLVWTGNSCC